MGRKRNAFATDRCKARGYSPELGLDNFLSTVLALPSEKSSLLSYVSQQQKWVKAYKSVLITRNDSLSVLFTGLHVLKLIVELAPGPGFLLNNLNPVRDLILECFARLWQYRNWKISSATPC